MATVYVSEVGAQVHKVDERIVIRKGKEVIEDIPLIKVDRLVLMGRGVGATTATLYELSQRGIDVVYLRRGGSFAFGVAGPDHKHSRLRYEQALKISRPEVTLPIAKAIVIGKIGNQRVLVQRHTRDKTGLQRVAQSLTEMSAMQAKAAQVKTMDELRGMEGKAAADYFGLYRQLLADPMGFERREYYPPPDPLNSMLSFGYTLLLRETEAAATMTGLDPALGVLHVIDYGRPSLALDLEEEFRAAIVDSVVLQAVNGGAIKRDDFQFDSQRKSWQLKDEGRKRFLGLYEARLSSQVEYVLDGQKTTWRRILLLQAQQLARVFLGEVTEYRPMEIR
jgi:CRISPR-associated protein Cas1